MLAGNIEAVDVWTDGRLDLPTRPIEAQAPSS
jgi:hypothetical protein